MGNPNAFLTIPRQEAGHRPVYERVSNFGEVEQVLNEGDRMLQASRCMDCGIPFCHWACPLGNRQPEWQDAVCKGKWELAYRLLSQTNDFPEFTGRICPALCEKSCVLNHSMDAPVTVRENECSIIERAFREGYVHPRQYTRNGRKVAVVGAGPAGLSAAVQLNKRGYDVTVLEKMPAAGGLVRYGIPNFKLDKYVIDRRIAVLEQEGITFRYGVTVDTKHLPEGFDAYVISTGTPTARDLPIPGRELKGIYFALDLLTQQNRRLAGEQFSEEETVSAKGRTVLVIGGGDTGSDCIGTCHRQGCKGVTQIEIMPKPPEGYNPATPWPAWPMILRTSTSHEEGCERRWSLSSCRFLDDGEGRVAGVEVEEVEWLPAPDGGRPQMKGTGRKSIIECDMVLLAMGFLKPQHPQFGPNVFLAGDARTGTSLVVRALAGGRAVAQEVDDYLNGRL